MDKFTRVKEQIPRLLPFLLVFSLSMIEEIRILIDFSSKYTNEDQTLLWYAAKEFVHGHLHEPNFFGQTYNTIYESVLGAIIHTIFIVPFNWSVPISTMALVTILWLSLAFSAYRRGKYNIALLALALPLIMRIQYIYLFEAPRGVMAGDLLATVAVVCALSLRNNALKISICIAFGGLAILWDYAAALIVIPVLIYLAYQSRIELLKDIRKTLTYIGAAVILPLAWLIGDKLWYAKHSYELTAADVSSKPHWSIFIHSIKHFSPYVAYLAPAIIPEAYVAIIILIILLIGIITISILRKSYGLLLSVLSLVFLVGLALSLERATNSLPDLYLSLARLLLTLPIAVWCLLFLTSIDGDKHRHGRKLIKIKPLTINVGFLSVILILSVASFITTEAQFKSTLSKSLSFDTQYFLVNASTINQDCSDINQVYINTNAQLYATNNRNLAYGCAAEYNKMNTLEPIYERRGWIIKASYTQPTTKILVAGTSCSLALPANVRCVVEPADTILIESPPMPAAKILNKIGLPVKYYTPAAD